MSAISRNIQLNVNGNEINYYDTIRYDRGQFDTIRCNYVRHRANRIAELNVVRYGYERVNLQVTLNPAIQSSILLATVLGAVTRDGTVCMEFLRGVTQTFDLMQFTDYARRLEWHGQLNGVPTSIVIYVPFTQSHCHWHIWQRK